MLAFPATTLQDQNALQGLPDLFERWQTMQICSQVEAMKCHNGCSLLRVYFNQNMYVREFWDFKPI